MQRAHRLIWAMGVAGVAFPALAQDSWSNEAGPTVTVHHHVFDRVRIDANGCELQVKLWFDAPAEAYADKRNPVRNHYQFRGQVSLSNGRKFETKVFMNRGAGRRVLTTKVDTSNEGCWAKKKAQIVKLDVNACRGQNCAVERFQ